MTTTWILCACLSFSALAQEAPPSSTPASASTDFSRVVLPLTEFKVKLRPELRPSASVKRMAAVGAEVKLGFGTAFCVDPECRFIGTSYHVAASMRVRRIKGIKVVHQYFATGPEDQGLSLNRITSEDLLSYNVGRDLAMFELRRSLPDYHGLPYSLDELEPGQPVDIYGYPKESIGPRRSLMQFHGEFKGETRMGLQVFAYQLSGDKAIRGGASGGLVVDRRTGRIVGILSEVAADGSRVALAVPVQALSKFVGKAQPWLAQRIFSDTQYISPALPDVYPGFKSPPPSLLGLQRRPEEPAEVNLLRNKAQSLVDSMQNFIAIQTFAWGSGNKPPAARTAYEVRVLNGSQQYREYPAGKKELDDVRIPPLRGSIIPGTDWADLPRMIGTKPRFQIKEAPDALIGGKRMKVFQYRADVEDAVCQFRWENDFGLFVKRRTETDNCYGEVWTNEDLNIIRISEHLDLRNKSTYQTVVTYGWLRRKGDEPRLIPVAIAAELASGKRVLWCRGEFINYQVFTTKARILSGSVTP